MEASLKNNKMTQIYLPASLASESQRLKFNRYSYMKGPKGKGESI